MGDFWNARWQQTYQVNRLFSVMCACSELEIYLQPPSIQKSLIVKDRCPLGVSQHMHKITCENFGHRSSKKKHPCCMKLCAFFVPGAFPRFKCLGEKAPLSQSLHYFTGSHFCRCFITSTALQGSLPSKFLWSFLFVLKYQRYTLLLWHYRQ